jgi:GntR family transcriptional regulator/MocR family aminotransferase
MRDLAVSRNSVLTALHMLQVEGYLESRQGAGTYVCVSEVDAMDEDAPVAVEGVGAPPTLAARLDVLGRFGLTEWLGRNDPVRFDFRYGRVVFPAASARAWSQVQTRRLRRGGWPLLPAGFQGEPVLRQALAVHLGLNRGIRCTPEQILITTGSQESLFLSLTALLERGDTLVLEKPGYEPARLLGELCGADLHHASVDEHGIDPATLPDAARLVFVTPSHQFPTGAVLPARRRHALYGWARRCGAWIYEDDYDSEFRYDIRPLPALKRLDVDGRVIHAGSFSKTMYAGIRLGFMVLPDALVTPLRELKTCTSGAVATFVQHAMAEFIVTGEYQRHLNRVCKIYGQRRGRLLDSLSRHCSGRVRWSGSQGGVHLFLRMPSNRDPAAFDQDARRSGVGVTVFPSGGGELRLALGYGGIDVADIEAGVAALADVI